MDAARASPQPSDEDINADLAQILHSGNAVRTYAATGASGKIPWLAGQVGLPVYSEWPADPFMPPQQAADFKPFEPALMGDMESLKINSCRANAHSGDTALELTYVSGGGKGWAGLTWLYPPGNWGQRPGGYPLLRAERLTYWARSDVAGMPVTVLVGGIGCGVSGMMHNDSLCPGITSKITLGAEWQEYTIDLPPYQREVRALLGGFGLTTNRPGTIYLDDIVYYLGKFGE